MKKFNFSDRKAVAIGYFKMDCVHRVLTSGWSSSMKFNAIALIPVALILSVAQAKCSTAGIRDNPIESDSIVYLDGAWTATLLSNSTDDCFCKKNTDFRTLQGDISGHRMDSGSKEECCALCLANESCIVGVHVDSSCWIKSVNDDVDGSESETGVTLCRRVSLQKSRSHTINASVPGDLITDLQTAGLIGDPLYELNFLNASLWSQPWVYKTAFTLPSGASHRLVFDGVKMGATVKVNGNIVGTTHDQFLRYVFTIPESIVDNTELHQTLEVEFAAPGAIDCGGRWMACSGKFLKTVHIYF